MGRRSFWALPQGLLHSIVVDLHCFQACPKVEGVPGEKGRESLV